MVSIAKRLREGPILEKAIERISNQGEMYFDKRSLFYVVEELYETKYGEGSFYNEYSSFTQDFLPKYEKENGEIENLVSAPRGKFSSPRFQGVVQPYSYDVVETEMDERKRDKIMFREGNKLILMEKSGLYEAFMENNFPTKLDSAFLTTQGFSTDLGQELAEEAEEKGLPVCAIHDFDVNGCWIRRSLEKPTKRRDHTIEKVHDLGFTWKDIKELREEGKVKLKEISLNKSDKQKLRTLLEQNEISEEAHEVLSNYEVKLNQLTPRELLNFIENKLKKMGLWKTTPTKDELKNQLSDEVEPYLNGLRDELDKRVNEESLTTSPILKELGIHEISKKLMELKSTIRAKLQDTLEEEVKEIYEEINEKNHASILVAKNNIGPSKIKKELEENQEQYWIQPTRRIAENYVKEIKNNLDIELDAKKYTKKLVNDNEIQEKYKELQKTMSEH